MPHPWYLRVGIIFTVTGLLALLHGLGLFGRTHHLAVSTEVVVAVVLLVIGLASLLLALRGRSHEGKPPRGTDR